MGFSPENLVNELKAYGKYYRLMISIFTKSNDLFIPNSD